MQVAGDIAYTEELFAGDGIPDLNGVVVTAGEQVVAISAESHCGDGLIMGVYFHYLLACNIVIEYHNAFFIATGKDIAAGLKYRAKYMAIVEVIVFVEDAGAGIEDGNKTIVVADAEVPGIGAKACLLRDEDIVVPEAFP